MKPRLALGLAIGLAGAGATWAASMAFNMSLAEALRLAAIAGGAALAAGAVGALLLWLLRNRSITAQITVVVLVCVAAVAAGALVAANSMFLSKHDLDSLLVILLAAGTVGALVAFALGQRVVAASRTVGAQVRRIVEEPGSAEPAGHPPPAETAARPSTPELAARPSTAELAALASEVEDMSARLEEARGRERALDTSRRELVAWVSHDLRTPLAGIRAIAEALEDGIVTDPATVEHYYRTLRLEADRLAGLVDDLFELSVIQAGALRLQLERVSLGDLVSDAVAAAAVGAEAKGVHVEGRLEAGSSPVVELSPPEVARVLRNLLENAIRHTPSDGTVWVSTGVAQDQVFVSVADQCGGISPDELGRVFDPSFRGETARTPRSDGGAGLGLAIARGIVEAHHGEIGVQNEGGGCRFTVRLPISAISTN